MNTGLAVNIAAVIISLSAILVSSLFARHQLRLMRRSDDTVVAIELLTRECRTEEFLNSEDYIVHRLPKQPPAEGISGLPPEGRRHISRVGLYYTSLGALIVTGSLQETMVVSLMPTRARRVWFALEPYIVKERELRSPTYLSFFEHLVCLIAEADLDEIHRNLRLRKIGTRSAQFRQEYLSRAPGARPPAPTQPA
ncbi:DUF4760 domain-containing protein [Paractinoplanes toevensis]|uniref:Uncharacterized protein n=1 Tax=Paractinoplanes toevensis TaxID=571911 RepID=A0A919VY23_9ACTN|nr:hypothetical protein [Actinoplanes toevensis]GIM88532.1 hypothetical protein Ato02nite_003250 [Actinoplanes toevensis]